MILGWVHVLIAATAFAVGGCYTYFYPGAQDDNPVEEAAEKVIKKEIGLDIDITPLSPEKDVKLEDVTDMKLTTDIDKKE
jgi:hypothetical protein